MPNFISFEGGDCAGKGCQVRLLTDHLRMAGKAVLTTREPGGTPAAEKIREGLLSGAFKDYGPIAEVMMFNAARTHHLNEAIRPAIARGEIVICDRFYDSTLAYQGAGDKVDADWIKVLQAAVVGDTIPDITFIIDVPVDVSIERLKGAAAIPIASKVLRVTFTSDFATPTSISPRRTQSGAASSMERSRSSTFTIEF